MDGRGIDHHSKMTRTAVFGFGGQWEIFSLTARRPGNVARTSLEHASAMDRTWVGIGGRALGHPLAMTDRGNFTIFPRSDVGECSTIHRPSVAICRPPVAHASPIGWNQCPMMTESRESHFVARWSAPGFQGDSSILRAILFWGDHDRCVA